MSATDDDVSRELIALAAEIKRLDDGASRVADLVMLRFGEAFMAAVDRLPDRADEIATATVREGVTATHRLLVDAAAELAALCRLAPSIKLVDEAERRRVEKILGDPLAAFSPELALALCAEGSTSAAAIEALRISAVAGAAPPSADPGGSRVQ
jgi:hypothetical protein